MIIQQISNLIPNEKISRDLIPISSNIQLADPSFHVPGLVDLLLGCGPTLSLFCVCQIDMSSQPGNDLILQKTRLGWVVGGSISILPVIRSENKCHFSDLQVDITKFWELEEYYDKRSLFDEQSKCEIHFQNHTTRDPCGQYVVALPFRANYKELGNSRAIALKRLFSLERKLNESSDLKKQYNGIFQEYLDLRHMSKVKEEKEIGFYLPHFAVFTEGIATTKVRIVFDGSVVSESGLSLYDTLMTGPTIQKDIFSHMLRFRSYCYVLTGDIEKMYRQFKIRKRREDISKNTLEA